MQKEIISFPHMGNYYIVAKYFFEHILDAKIMTPPKITSKTIEIGSKYSPDFVCTPFKYTLGTMIESLDKGATVLLQAGGGCRYGYYSELQEKILTELGYKFTYINFVSEGTNDLKKIYHQLKKIDPKFRIRKGIYYLFIASKMIRYMDRVDDYMRMNIGFEKEKNSFEKLNKKMLREFGKVKGYFHLRKTYHMYLKKMKKLPVIKNDNPLRVGIIGELYTLMEPFSNYDLEKEMAQYGIEIKRYTNAHYLLFEKSKKIKKYLKYAKNYIRYKMGSDAADNIARTKYLCEKKYDGIIHIKSSFCTPEIGAMPIIHKICKEYNMPIIFFSFDSNTSAIGIKTRCEAFYDMIEMRKQDEKLLSRD